MSDETTFSQATSSLLAAVDACCREVSVASNPTVAGQWAETAATLAEACASLQFRREEDE